MRRALLIVVMAFAGTAMAESDLKGLADQVTKSEKSRRPAMVKEFHLELSNRIESLKEKDPQNEKLVPWIEERMLLTPLLALARESLSESRCQSARQEIDYMELLGQEEEAELSPSAKASIRILDSLCEKTK